MKIKSVVPVGGKIENVRIMRPCQSLLLHITTTEDFQTSLLDAANYSHALLSYAIGDLSAKMTARLISQDSGKMETFIPAMQLSELGELAVFGEGHISGNVSSFVIPVLLNPVHSLNLSQNKYVELDFSSCENIASMDIYSVETGVLADNLFKYQKLSCPVGNARTDFKNNVSDFVLLPKDGFDYVELTYSTGVTAILTPLELQYLNHAKNDVVMVGFSGGSSIEVVPANDADADLESITSMVCGFLNSVILQTSSITSISIVRESDSATAMHVVFGEYVTL